MPISMCWPSGEYSQVNVEGMRSLRNVSVMRSRANSPRRLTQAPRLVEIVTSGDAVTMRAASADLPRPSSFRSAPKPACVDISGWIDHVELARDLEPRRRQAALTLGNERHRFKKRTKLVQQTRTVLRTGPTHGLA